MNSWLGALIDVAFTPPWIFVVWAVVIGGELYWLVVRKAQRVARKRRAELLARFLEHVLEPTLYETLRAVPEGSHRSYILGVTPGPATILYRMFEELGGVEALPLEKAERWKRTLGRLADKLGFDMEYVPGVEGCRHLIVFNRISSK